MPVARIKLRNEFRLGDPELYRGAAVRNEGAQAILDGVAAAGIVGILRQLGDVAEFGAEIFQDLHEQVMTTYSRGNRMLSRIRKIEEALPSIEDAISRKGSYIDLAYESGSDWRSKVSTTDTHLSYNDFPQFMMDLYEECRDPPRLFLLDKYDREGSGACLKRYSDPSYFKRARATSEPKKAQQIQKEKKLKKTKRKYTTLKFGEIQVPVPPSKLKSLATNARLPLGNNNGERFSAEGSSFPEIIGGPQLLNTLDKLNCTEQFSDAYPSFMPNEFNRLSISNVPNNQDHSNVFKWHSKKHVLGVDCDSHYDFMTRKSTLGSPSALGNEKPELIKAECLRFSNGTHQDLKISSVNSEASKVEEPAKNASLDKAKLFQSNLEFPNPCDNEIFEDINEVDCYMDALNMLESEAEPDSECHTECIQSLSNKGHHNNESENAKMNMKYVNSSIGVPMALLDSSNKGLLPKDASLDLSRTQELKQPIQEAGFTPSSPSDGSRFYINSLVNMSRPNNFQEINSDRARWSNEVKSETSEAASLNHFSPPINVSNIPSINLWTNGNLLGLQPSKPHDICLPNGPGESIESNGLNSSMESDKKRVVNDQISQHCNSINKVENSPKPLYLSDQRSLNSNQFLSPKYVEESISMRHSSTNLDCHYDDFCTKQNSGAEPETISFSHHEESSVASPNVLSTHNCQVHQSTSIASPRETEPCRSFNVALKCSKFLSPSFLGLSQRNLLQGLQLKTSVIQSKSSIQDDPSFSNSQSEGRLLTDNGVASQTFYEQNLAHQTSDEQNLVNNPSALIETSISSSSHYSQNCSPPLEHMKLSFHPMNDQVSSNSKLEVPDGCIGQRRGGKEFPLFRLFPECTLPSKDGGSESDDDSFSRSYPYSTEDLPSTGSDSNSDIWEQDDCSASKMIENSDDLQRISSSTASISGYSAFEPMKHVGEEIGLLDFCSRNDQVPFQHGYIANIPSLESLINHVKYDSLSSSLKGASTLEPTELPPPPPLPPIQWRLMRSSYEIYDDNYSNMPELVEDFVNSQKQYLSAPEKNESIIQKLPTVVEDEQFKNMQDKQKMDSLLQTDLSVNPSELNRREQLLHQIKDMGIRQMFKTCEESKNQVSTSKGFEEKRDLLHQIRTKQSPVAPATQVHHQLYNPKTIAPMAATSEVVARRSGSGKRSLQVEASQSQRCSSCRSADLDQRQMWLSKQKRKRGGMLGLGGVDAPVSDTMLKKR